MSTIVFQGIHQSCKEPQMVETRKLRLKHSSPTVVSGTWNFIESLTTKTLEQYETLYVVNPMTKTSFLKLSKRSLELCTENLGCETGTDMMGNFFSLPLMELNVEETKRREQYTQRRSLDTRKNNIKNFPPPLTSMSGSNSLQVRPIRERGRLLIEAVELPPSHGCFQTKRSNGRLTLSLFRQNDQPVAKNETENLLNEEACEREEHFEGIEEDCRGEAKAFVSGDMEGISKKVGVEMGIEKSLYPTRYKEGGSCKWEPFWVATS